MGAAVLALSFLAYGFVHLNSAHAQAMSGSCTSASQCTELPDGMCNSGVCQYGGAGCTTSANCAVGYTCQSESTGNECIFTGETSQTPATASQLGVCGAGRPCSSGSCIDGDSPSAYCSSSGGNVQGSLPIQQLLGALPAASTASCTNLQDNSGPGLPPPAGIVSCETTFCGEATALGYTCNAAANCSNVYNANPLDPTMGVWDYSCTLSGTGALGTLNEALNPGAVVGETGTGAAGNNWWTLAGQGTGTPVIPTLPVTGSTPTTPTTPTTPVTTTSGNIITGVQGYNPATDIYTDGTALVNTYLVIYGGTSNFGASGNTVTINGSPATVSSQSVAQINVSLAGIPAVSNMQYTVVVKTPTGATGSANFTISATAITGTGTGTSCSQQLSQLSSLASQLSAGTLNGGVASLFAQTAQQLQNFLNTCPTTPTTPTNSATVDSIAGVQGYDPSTGVYTPNTALVNTYLVLYGNFSDASNFTTIDGQPATVTSQSTNQVNISLSGISAGTHTIVITPGSGSAATATFVITAAGNSGTGTTTTSTGTGSCSVSSPVTTGFPLTVVVTGSDGVNVRSTPSISGQVVDSLAYQQTFTAIAEVSGDCVGSNDLWWEISPNSYIWAGNTTVQGGAGTSVNSGSTVTPAIVSVQGYNPTTQTYGNPATINTDLVLYGSFANTGNNVSIDGSVNGSIFYQSANQINISLVGVSTGNHTVAVSNSAGASNATAFSVSGAGGGGASGGSSATGASCVTDPSSGQTICLQNGLCSVNSAGQTICLCGPGYLSNAGGSCVVATSGSNGSGSNTSGSGSNNSSGNSTTASTCTSAQASSANCNSTALCAVNGDGVPSCVCGSGTHPSGSGSGSQLTCGSSSSSGGSTCSEAQSDDADCGINATCAVVSGTPTCTCGTGYTKDPEDAKACVSSESCSDAQQEAAGCGTNADCTVDNGTPTCGCSNGYSTDPSNPKACIASPACSAEQAETENCSDENEYCTIDNGVPGCSSFLQSTSCDQAQASEANCNEDQKCVMPAGDGQSPQCVDNSDEQACSSAQAAAADCSDDQECVANGLNFTCQDSSNSTAVDTCTDQQISDCALEGESCDNATGDCIAGGSSDSNNSGDSSSVGGGGGGDDTCALFSDCGPEMNVE